MQVEFEGERFDLKAGENYLPDIEIKDGEHVMTFTGHGIVTDGRTYCLHDQRDRNLRVIEPRLTLTLNKTGALTFRIPSSHMYSNTLKKMKSSIQVMEDGILIYEGRVL